MIAFLQGTIAAKGSGRLVLDVGGVGYEVLAAASTLERLPPPGQTAKLLIAESFGMYGGGTTLYGFADAEERELFDTLRENVPSTGAKKALELLDKAAKSLPDFRRAIFEKDARILAGVFGFSKKTADRLILSLKDKLAPGPGHGRGFRAAEPSPALGQVQNALAALGYKAAEARAVLDQVQGELGGRAASVEEMVRLALKRL